MIQDTIRRVKEAEEQAQQILSDTKAKAEELVKDAHSQAEETSRKAKELAQDAAKAVIDAAKAKNEKAFAQADEEVKTDVLSLKETAAANEDAAVKQIIEAVLS